MSQLGLAATASKALPLLPNRQRSPAGTTFPSSALPRPSNRRKNHTRSLRDGGNEVSDAKKHSQSVRQGTVNILRYKLNFCFKIIYGVLSWLILFICFNIVMFEASF